MSNSCLSCFLTNDFNDKNIEILNVVYVTAVISCCGCGLLAVINVVAHVFRRQQVKSAYGTLRHNLTIKLDQEPILDGINSESNNVISNNNKNNRGESLLSASPFDDDRDDFEISFGH